MGDQLRPDWSGRLTRAWQQAAAANRAALIVSTPTNLLYLCGFAGSQGVLVLSANARWLMLDGRYEQATREAIAAGEVGPVDVKPVPSRFDQALADACASLPAGEIAFEGDHVTVSTLTGWQTAIPGRAFAATSGLIEKLRIVKDAHELHAIRRACRLTSDVARHLSSWVAEGRTERQVASAASMSLATCRSVRPSATHDER